MATSNIPNAETIQQILDLTHPELLPPKPLVDGITDYQTCNEFRLAQQSVNDLAIICAKCRDSWYETRDEIAFITFIQSLVSGCS